MLGSGDEPDPFVFDTIIQKGVLQINTFFRKILLTKRVWCARMEMDKEIGREGSPMQ